MKIKIKDFNINKCYYSTFNPRYYSTIIYKSTSIIILKRYGSEDKIIKATAETTKATAPINRALIVYRPRPTALVPFNRNINPLRNQNDSSVPNILFGPILCRPTSSRPVFSSVPLPPRHTHRVINGFNSTTNHLLQGLLDNILRIFHQSTPVQDENVETNNSSDNTRPMIEFEPHEIGSARYNLVMDYFRDLRNKIFNSPNLSNTNNQNNSVTSTSTTTSTSNPENNITTTTSNTSNTNENNNIISTTTSSTFSSENKITNTSLSDVSTANITSPSNTTTSTTSTDNTSIALETTNASSSTNNTSSINNNTTTNTSSDPLLIGTYSLPSEDKEYVQAKTNIFNVTNLTIEELEQYKENVTNILLKFQTDKTISFEDLEILADYLKIIQHPNIDVLYKCDEHILNLLGQLITHGPLRETIPFRPTRDMEEFERLKYYPDAERILRLLSLEKPLHPYLPDEYEQTIHIDKEILSILSEGHNNLYTPHFIELLRRSGILINNDAQSSIGVIEQGETHKLKREAAEMANELFGNTEKILNNEDYQVLLTNIQNEEFIEGYLERDLNLHLGNAEVLSGHDLHPLILIQDPRNQDYYLCLAMMTSANDKGTIKISDKQLYGGGSHKVQYMRPATRLTRIPKNQVRQDLQLKSDLEIDKDIIKDAIINVSPIFKDNPISEPIIFNKDLLTQLAISFLKEKITQNQEKLISLLKEINSLKEPERSTRLKNLKISSETNKKIAQEKAIDKNTPQPFRIFKNIHRILKENIKKVKDQDKSNKKKIKNEEEKTKSSIKREKNNDDENKKNTNDKNEKHTNLFR